MFYNIDLLTRRGVFALAWYARPDFSSLVLSLLSSLQ